ncbi:MAG TPA: universal stress protein [Aquaticitalea sp.]|nr:universal stress protein [Aquaticitalea sp.]
MRKIIVPIDFSKYADYALKAAAILAKSNDAQILALHMLEMSDSVLTTTDVEQHEKIHYFLRLAQKRFDDFLDKPYLKGVDVVPIVKHFKVFSEVNQVAEDHSADMIVMGSHGASGFSEYFVGSNTERVIRHSTIPVLVIKSEPKNLDFKNVIFASDFKDEAIKSYINAMNLIKEFKAEVHLLHVNVPGENFMSTTELEEQVSGFLQKADGNLNRLDRVRYVADISVERGILNYAKKINADMIVMPTHGRKGLSHIFEGSISEDLANHADYPVMTFKI